MRARVVICAFLAVEAVSVAAGMAPAGAGDLGGQNSWANAQASGGQLTVQAGQTVWIPPSGSTWATRASSSPPPGKPNPNQPYGCTYQIDPQGQQLLGAGGLTPGQWVFPICAGPGVLNPMPPFWVAQPQAQAAAVQVNPAVVAQQAFTKLAFASPTIEMAPPDGSPQLVGVASWLWLAPGAWQTLTASASAGTVTATATATPAKVVWEMGDGNQVICEGPGTPYSSSEPNATTDCSYAWPQAGTFTVMATVYWSVTWTATGAPGGGNLGVQAGPPAQVQVTVIESQAINTPTGGSD